MPWLAGWPAKPQRFMTPWKPLPSVVPWMSTYCPATKWSARSSVPAGSSASPVTCTQPSSESQAPWLRHLMTEAARRMHKDSCEISARHCDWSEQRRQEDPQDGSWQLVIHQLLRELTWRNCNTQPPTCLIKTNLDPISGQETGRMKPVEAKDTAGDISAGRLDMPLTSIVLSHACLGPGHISKHGRNVLW